METQTAYVHALVFQCPQCGSPICAQALRPERSLEHSHVSSFHLKCSSCGWSDELLGVQARLHWVEPWSNGKRSAT